MERYIGLDAHAASCTLPAISDAGSRAHRKKKRALLDQCVIVRFREGHEGVDVAP
jgi:hypothetical protein